MGDYWNIGNQTIRGFQQFCRDWRPTVGSDLPVLALHGSLTQSGMWIALAETAASIRIVCPDQRGFGRSEDPDGDSCKEFASDAAELAKKLLPLRYVVMGHSFACAVALQVARNAAEQVIAAVLVDPVVHLENAAAPATAPAVESPGSFENLEACERHFRESEEGDWSDDAIRRFVQDIMILDNGGSWRLPYSSKRLRRLRAFTASPQNDYNLLAEAKAARCPVLVFRGVMSRRFCGSAEQPFLEAFASRPRIVRCLRSGHFPTATDTNIVATELKKFMQDLSQSL